MSPGKGPPVIYAQGQRPVSGSMPAAPAPTPVAAAAAVAGALPRLTRVTPGTGRTDAPAALAAMGRASGVPADDAPVELEASDIEMVESLEPLVTPLSGLPAPDEWLGHVLLGYAPFGVTVAHRTTSREMPMLDGDGLVPAKR